MTRPAQLTASPALPATPWTAVGVVVAAGIIGALQVGKAVIVAPLLQADMHLGLAAIGRLVGVFSLLGLLGGLFAGVWTGRMGARRVLRLGLLIVLAGCVLGALSRDYEELLWTRVIEGAGFLLITVAAPSILGVLAAPSRRNVVMALWSCFMPAGMALAMLAGPWFESWRALWWACAAMVALALCAVFIAVPDAGMRRLQPWRQLAGDAMATLMARGPLLIAAIFGLYSLMFFALFSFLPVLLMERMNVTHQSAGELSALAIAANILGNLAAGLLLSKGVPRALILAGASLIMGASGLGIFVDVLPGTPAFLLCIVYAAVGGLIPATLLSAAPLAARNSILVPLVMGLAMQGNNLGQIVGPMLVGSVIQYWSWSAAAIVAASAAVVIVLIAKPAMDLPPR
ncbi:CynX/NimT family MFS transporter [Kerstersia gyiorum]|uniref:MFS transporter n=1 Tax=Kerstersia gyiorum TaxID=206506 RepID=UPI00209FAFAD|nr:MFS transporter [Kerstersia gyiorum]MCP1632573.1 putative MFS family arabinose efflux permease [Kerstersia gyiorum]MCP1635896.1 putative MFS family arabinose efflux permease [Kerstersia gyiorum]MCP1678650.1 putative MFS family arabinose efflux permease [Kerstersia gyiorum]MCP1682449.1 putative MFS family arabinose efflux permease [Kerstersia gyiorum]MCP1711440.1 putative MFS family arabinose efflux permease [Kerstersia gyiorum]